MAPLLANRAPKLKSASLPALWFLTDETRTPDPAAALAALPRGSAVIFRHYGVPDRADLARKLAALCAKQGLLFLVADDWRLAAVVGADGLHLPEYAARCVLPSGAKIWLRQKRAWLTVAAHGARGLARAHAVKATAALLAPVFPTRSHPGRAALGLARAAALVRAARVPVLALGGATPAQFTHVCAAGFAGIAGIGFAVEKRS